MVDHKVDLDSFEWIRQRLRRSGIDRMRFLFCTDPALMQEATEGKREPCAIVLSMHHVSILPCSPPTHTHNLSTPKLSPHFCRTKIDASVILRFASIFFCQCIFTTVSVVTTRSSCAHQEGTGMLSVRNLGDCIAFHPQAANPYAVIGGRNRAQKMKGLLQCSTAVQVGAARQVRHRQTRGRMSHHPSSSQPASLELKTTVSLFSLYGSHHRARVRNQAARATQVIPRSSSSLRPSVRPNSGPRCVIPCLVIKPHV